MSIFHLPVELLYEISEYLNYKELLQLRLSCSYIYYMFEHEIVDHEDKYTDNFILYCTENNLKSFSWTFLAEYASTKLLCTIIEKNRYKISRPIDLKTLMSQTIERFELLWEIRFRKLTPYMRIQAFCINAELFEYLEDTYKCDDEFVEHEMNCRILCEYENVDALLYYVDTYNVPYDKIIKYLNSSYTLIKFIIDNGFAPDNIINSLMCYCDVNLDALKYAVEQGYELPEMNMNNLHYWIREEIFMYLYSLNIINIDLILQSNNNSYIINIGFDYYKFSSNNKIRIIKSFSWKEISRLYKTLSKNDQEDFSVYIITHSNGQKRKRLKRWLNLKN